MGWFVTSKNNFALGTAFISKALPSLEAGEIQLSANLRVAPTASSLSHPPLPAIYQGTVTLKGAPPATGTRLYARVVNQAIGDTWIRTKVMENGKYMLPLGVSNNGYVNAIVEFYMEGTKAEIQGLNASDEGSLRYKARGHRSLDLVFA